MSVIIDGTAGITFPSGSGTQAAQSKVLQVVSATTLGSITSTSSTSFVTTGLTASITPLFSTSKILIIVNSICSTALTSNYGSYTIYRNSTNLGGINGFVLINNGGQDASLAMSYLDSPASTSSTTYTTYIRVTNASQSVYLGDGNATSAITLMEIAT